MGICVHKVRKHFASCATYAANSRLIIHQEDFNHLQTSLLPNDELVCFKTQNLFLLVTFSLEWKGTFGKFISISINKKLPFPIASRLLWGEMLLYGIGFHLYQRITEKRTFGKLHYHDIAIDENIFQLSKSYKYFLKSLKIKKAEGIVHFFNK